MFEENINFIKESIKEGNPSYGIISLLSDTFDAMRTEIRDDSIDSKKRLKFDKAIGKILDGMKDLDKLIEDPK